MVTKAGVRISKSRHIKSLFNADSIDNSGNLVIKLPLKTKPNQINFLRSKKRNKNMLLSIRHSLLSCNDPEF